MTLTKSALSFIALLSTLPYTTAQAPQGTPYTDPTTNITFSTWSTPASSGTGPVKFGLTLPPTALKSDATDFIGYVNCAPGSGWCGISLGGAMTDSLLLVSYADGESKEVKHTLRFTTEYALPGLYKGNATVMPISSTVTEESFTSIFLCQDCLAWEQDGSVGKASTSGGMLDLAYAISPEMPTGAECADEAVFVQHQGQGTWVGLVDEGAASQEYETWVGLAKEGGGGAC